MITRSRSDPVGATSRWTAAARAVESAEPEPLFRDELADELSGAEGFAMMRHFEQYTGRNLILPLRTRFLDDLIRASMNDGIRQVVLVAAGLDTRGVRLTWPAGTTLFELDRSEVLDHKQHILERHGVEPRCSRRAVPVDLAVDGVDVLPDHGFDPGLATLWIVEGLLCYLTVRQAHGLVGGLARHSAPGSVIGFDVIGERFLDSPTMTGYRAALDAVGAPWRFGTDQPEELLVAGGWTPRSVTQPGEPGADGKTLPYPVVPRGTDVPGLPRVLFAVGSVPRGTAPLAS